MQGLVFNIQRFSLHDGPGIRTTVFLKGCPLKCKWCSNPESIEDYPQIIAYSSRCLGCGKCAEVCPQEAITIINNKSVIDWDICNECLKCAGVCLNGGIVQVGKRMSSDEVLAEVEKDEMFYINSGGGVTFSGGEPLNQWAFVVETSRICKEKGLHIALDTTGCADWDKIETVIEYVDLVLYDIKHLDSVRHRAWTGIDNHIILENAMKVAERTRTWFRVPLIPGFNDSADLLRDIVALAEKAGVERVSLLPYHRLSVSKYTGLGKKYPLEDLEEIQEERLLELKRIIQSDLVEVTLRE